MKNIVKYAEDIYIISKISELNIKLDKNKKYVIILINSFSKEWCSPLFDYVE